VGSLQNVNHPQDEKHAESVIKFISFYDAGGGGIRVEDFVEWECS
jgi:hypothetical protein